MPTTQFNATDKPDDKSAITFQIQFKPDAMQVGEQELALLMSILNEITLEMQKIEHPSATS